MSDTTMPERRQNLLGAQLTCAALEGDVHPLLHRLRAEEPVAWVPALHAWLVTRYDDAITVMRDAATFTVDHPGFSTAQVVGPSMLSLDGNAHARHRRPFEAPFRQAAVQTRFRSVVAQSVQQQIDSFASQGYAELRRGYAGPIAVQTMISALGLDGTTVVEVLGWYDAIVAAVTEVSSGAPVSAEGRRAFAALGERLLPMLQAPPDSSLLAAAGGVHTGLSNDQIVANAAVLLFGGIETTEGMLANALAYFLTEPAARNVVRADPALVALAIEETLRLEPAAAVVDRYAVRDVQLGTAAIAAGDLVRVSLTAANRDPERFPEPDRFDPLRPNLRTHVAFAQGPHVCLGLHLARLEGQLALTQLFARLPDLRLATSADARAAARPRGLIFRKPQALHAIWQI